jgi:hypothetical protein
MSNSGFFWGRKAGWAREGKKGTSPDLPCFPLLVKVFSVVDSTLVFVISFWVVLEFMTVFLAFMFLKSPVPFRAISPGIGRHSGIGNFSL